MEQFKFKATKDEKVEGGEPSNSAPVSIRTQSTLQLPPGYRFRPTNIVLLKEYLVNRIALGYCKWNKIEIVDILAYQPWHLPGMDPEEKEGYYYCEREKKSKGAGSNRSNRIIKCDPQSFWRMSSSADIIERDTLWGKHKTLNHYYQGRRTDWLMYELLLDESRAPHQMDNPIAVYKVYEKKSTKEKKEGQGCGKRQRVSEEATETTVTDENVLGLGLVSRQSLFPGSQLKQEDVVQYPADNHFQGSSSGLSLGGADGRELDYDGSLQFIVDDDQRFYTVQYPYRYFH